MIDITTTLLASQRDSTRILLPKAIEDTPLPTMTEAELGEAMKIDALKMPRFTGVSETGRAAIVKQRRKQILGVLTDWMCVHELTNLIGIGMATASKDLGSLKADGKIEMRKEGRAFLYRATSE